MVSYVKLEKIIADLIETANTVKAEDFAALKDVQIGKLYFATESLIGAVENFIEKIDTEIMKRNDIIIPEIGQKIVKESEPVLKIKKLSKAEIAAATAPAPKAAAAKPKAAASAKPKAAAPAKPKAAAPAKPKEVK
jgi:hypothetical protein